MDFKARKTKGHLHSIRYLIKFALNHSWAHRIANYKEWEQMRTFPQYPLPVPTLTPAPIPHPLPKKRDQLWNRILGLRSLTHTFILNTCILSFFISFFQVYWSYWRERTLFLYKYFVISDGSWHMLFSYTTCCVS